MDRLTTGPANGGSSYTYADAAHLHAATATSGGYSATYDAAGNMVCRAENNTSGTCAGSNPASWTGAALGWDTAGRLVSWQNTPTNPSSTDAYAYDGEGQRVWQQSTASGTGTPSTTVYVGANLVDYTYGSGGSSTGHTNRYVLPGGIGLLGVRGGSSVHLLLTDHLGTPVVQLDAASGAVQNELLTQPYGRYRYAATTLYTEAFTGQRRDTTPDVMYFNARYYDQQSGAFLSADTVLDGLNRYAYVGGNPESATDPSGHAQCYECVGAAAGGDWFNSGGVGPGTTVLYDLAEDTLGLVSIYHDVKTILNPDADLATKLGAFGDVLVQGGLDALMLTGEGEELRGAELSGRTADELTRAAVKASEWTDDAAKAGLVADDGLNVPGRVAEEDAAKAAAAAGDEGPRPHGGGSPGDEGPGHGGGPSGQGCGGLSFSGDTEVATPQGEQPIAALHVGDAVEAYDPTTGTTSTQHVQHVFINHDTDLLDVTLRSPTPADEQAGITADGQVQGVSVPGRVRAAALQASSRRQQQRVAQTVAATGRVETVHTTASHPWLTADRGWEQAGVLHIGEAVVRADGSTAMVVALHVVPGAADMWDLTVSNVHTFAVGSGAYVVHNCASAPPPGTKIVGTPSGSNVPVPDNWPGRVANNGKGLVFQEPGAAGNANMVRIMDPTPRYPQGYVRYYNQYGQPLDIFGRPGPLSATHIPLDMLGGAPGYYNWLAGFP